ncbi:uncharacterized protein LOC135143068 [Zophobas morio]|uniref:uncharacterized protein LOC135143068 n=1 Tax=Zophobas morio TaxID=2755281 RepID=UPI003082E3A6
MAADDVSEKFQGLKIKENQDINILLLGETGVGKSTFINAIANYFHFKTFKKASKAQDLLSLIPSVITVTNENLEQVTITVGKDTNEYQEIGAAGTQDVKTYVFPIGEGKTRLRLIDSPGMGDPRGIEQDDINCENILAYLAQLKELHAICFLMKPTTTRKTILFEYCVNQILSRLEKSASKNIIFIFTNTRGSNYSPGDTLPCLKTIIDDIKAKPPYVSIPLKDNIFSVDNEAFRFLIAMKKGIKFDDSVKERFIDSWNKSAKECWRLISYIVGDASRDALKPHQLLNTISINEARRIIVYLSQPLADISQLIHDNLRILERHKQNLRVENQSLDELKKQLFIPVINLEVTQLTQPVTVCTSTKCADLVKVGEVQKWHYKQRCHDPCYLRNVTKEIVGDVNLQGCAAMNGARTCGKCTCDFSVHMHIYYMTKTISDKLEDEVVKNNINKKEEALRESKRLIQQIDLRKNELEQERAIIIKSTAQFAHFLQYNAISPFNDSYKGYIEYLITRERSLGRHGDLEVVHNLEQLLYQYEQIKEAFENTLNLDKQLGITTHGSTTVTAQTVLDTIHNLYQLKHNGKKIHELLKKQRAPRNSEYDDSCEYIHPKSSDLSHAEGKKEKDKKTTKTDDEKKKKKDGKSTEDERKYKKGGKSTDDERLQKKGNRNFYPLNRSCSHEQQVSQPRPNPTHWREPPPPYDDRRQYRPPQQHPSHQGKPQEPNVFVTVELNKQGKDQRGPGGSDHQGYGPPEHGYHPGSQYYGHGQYQGPPHGQYYNQNYGPPPPSGPYYGPPQGHYGAPPQGHYYGPPQGPYHGPPGHYQGPQGHYQGPPGQYQGPQGSHYYGNRGRGYHNRGGTRKRGQSKPRSSKGGKSGTEKSSRSSDSDS